MLSRTLGFLRKNSEHKKLALRSRFNHLASKLPFFPVRMVLQGRHEQEVEFLWHSLIQAWNFEAWHRQKISRFFYKCWDVHELAVAMELIGPGQCVLDVGAWRGMFSLMSSKLVGDEGRVIAFEPSSRERFWFRLNMLLNFSKKIKLEDLALGRDSESRPFYSVASGDVTMNSLRQMSADFKYTTSLTKTSTLNDYYKKHALPNVDFIKVDIEGGEKDFFIGACQVLRACRPIILCEVTDATCHPWGYQARELIDILIEFDYVWFEVDSDMSLKEHTPKDEYGGHANYFAFPAEKHPAQ